MDYPDNNEENQPAQEKPESSIVNDKKKKGMGITLWPKMNKSESPNRSNQGSKFLTFLKDWSDIIFISPILLILFLTGQYWITKINPTSQFLDPENLTVLNWNLFLTFLGSGVIFVLFKIWVGGSIFTQNWKEELTPFQVLCVKIAMIGMIAIYVAYMITRNV